MDGLSSLVGFVGGIGRVLKGLVDGLGSLVDLVGGVVVGPLGGLERRGR